MQRTLADVSQVKHVVVMGDYKHPLDPEQDPDFYAALEDVGIDKGSQVRLRRGGFDITLKCYQVDLEAALWKKVRS